MTFIELINKISSILPEAQIETDSDGQLIVYTNLCVENDDDN
jgi:hypothetical protein